MPQRTRRSYRWVAYGPTELFRQAIDMHDQGECAEAVRLYDQVEAEFPESGYAVPAMYNAALCLKEMGRNEAASRYFSWVAGHATDTSDGLQALISLAELDMVRAKWESAASRFRALVAEKRLSAEERVEARYQLGKALHMQGSHAEAAETLETVLKLFRHHLSASDAAYARVLLAESYRDLALTKHEDVSVLARLRLLERAQAAYLTVMSTAPAGLMGLAERRLKTMHAEFAATQDARVALVDPSSLPMSDQDATRPWVIKLRQASRVAVARIKERRVRASSRETDSAVAVARRRP